MDDSRPTITRRGYTLIEVLIVVTIMGIAGALVIPSIDQAGVLRSQAAVRTIVSDLVVAQADAVAMQEQRAVVFSPETNSYALYRARGADFETDENLMIDPFNPNTDRYEVTFTQEQFGVVQLTDAEFDGTGSAVVFDEFGAPVVAVGSNTPSTGGTITLVDDYFTFTVDLQAFTGRVVTSKVELP